VRRGNLRDVLADLVCMDLQVQEHDGSDFM
jgi:hypothetical protein